MYRCKDCGKVLSSMGGVKLHRKKKHKTTVECDNESCQFQWHGLCLKAEIKLVRVGNTQTVRLLSCVSMEAQT